MSNGEWLPGEPESSGSGNYFRMKDLDALPDKTAYLRILCPFISGWEAWDEAGKPHRFPTKAEIAESGIKLRPEEGGKKNPKQFWATAVWNEASAKVQVFSFTQSSVFTQLKALSVNARWGQLDGYDISITRKGTGTDTEYTILPCGKEPLSVDGAAAWAALSAKWVGLDALYAGANPFDDFAS